MIEQIPHQVLIGQSMGGYVSQCFMEKYPKEAIGFISIDCAPLNKRYVSALELWLLKRTEAMYRAFPWKTLKKLGIEGCSKTEYGRKLMAHFLNTYTKNEYCKLAGHGYQVLAQAMEQNLEYKQNFPTILICGTEDQAGSAKSYNKRWAKREGYPLYWIKGAGHNANTDQPEQVSKIIQAFIKTL